MNGRCSSVDGENSSPHRLDNGDKRREERSHLERKQGEHRGSRAPTKARGEKPGRRRGTLPRSRGRECAKPSDECSGAFGRRLRFPEPHEELKNFSKNPRRLARLEGYIAKRRVTQNQQVFRILRREFNTIKSYSIINDRWRPAK